ncbi:hypothetical protein FRC11_004352 [Ceratobasidium sp. 423]|nr:hypothetical protein FRC11_004352 [Ceratobasidium sp. 423]
MGTDKPPFSPLNSSLAPFFAFLAESNPSYEFVSSYQIDPDMQNEKCYRNCANPILASQSSRYSSIRVGSGEPLAQDIIKTTDSSPNGGINNPKARLSTQARDNQLQLQKIDRHRFDMVVHPEGLPYFYQDKLVTTDNIDDPHVKELITSAVALVCFMLKRMKDIQEDFTFHEEVELSDHARQIIFWADSREPESIREAKGVIRDNILREEYWKHVEYYPCHREVPKAHIEELKDLMAACATGKCSRAQPKQPS